jgi:hypothetical protein
MSMRVRVRPLRRVFKDVFLDAQKVILVADDMFVVVTLPHMQSGGPACRIDAAGCKRLEAAHNLRQSMAVPFWGYAAPATMLRRGGFQTRPYAPWLRKECDEAMHMIGHDDENIERDVRVVARQLLPALADDLTCRFNKTSPSPTAPSSRSCPYTQIVTKYIPGEA